MAVSHFRNIGHRNRGYSGKRSCQPAQHKYHRDNRLHHTHFCHLDICLMIINRTKYWLKVFSLPLDTIKAIQTVTVRHSTVVRRKDISVV